MGGSGRNGLGVSRQAHEAMARMWADGLGVKRIAYEAGLTPQQVRGYAERHRDDFPRRCVRHRVTEEQREHIRALRSTGMTMARISNMVGCSPSMVSKVLRGVA